MFCLIIQYLFCSLVALIYIYFSLDMLRTALRGALRTAIQWKYTKVGVSQASLPSGALSLLNSWKTYPTMAYCFSTSSDKDQKTHHESEKSSFKNEKRQSNELTVSTTTNENSVSHKNFEQFSNINNGHSQKNIIDAIPIGTQDFWEIIKYFGYVDKTLLIEYILFGGKKVISINLPRRWGKSVTLSMIQWCFAWFIQLEKEISKELQKIEELTKQQEKLDKDYKAMMNQIQTELPLLQNLPASSQLKKKLINRQNKLLQKIISKQEKLQQQQSKYQQIIALKKKKLSDNLFFKEMLEGKELLSKLPNLPTYPIIHFSLEALSEKNQLADFDIVMINLKMSISRLFKRHTYLKNYLQNQIKDKQGDLSHQTLLKRFLKIHDFEDNYMAIENETKRKKLINNFTNQDFIKSIVFLSELLQKCWNKKPIILVDEYDQAFIKNLNKPFKQSLFLILSQFYKSFFKGQGAKHNFKVIIMGIAPITYNDEFSSTNNVTQINIGEFEDLPVGQCYFGYTGFEVRKKLEQVFKKIEERTWEEQKKEIKFSKELIDQQFEIMKSWGNGYWAWGQELYNPWTANNCLQKILNSGSWPVRQFSPKWYKTGHLTLLKKVIDEADEEQEDKIRKFVVDNYEYYNENDIDFTSRVHVNDLLKFHNFIFLLYHTGYLTVDKQRPKYLKVPNKEIATRFYPDLFQMLLEKRYPGILSKIETDKQNNIVKLVNQALDNIEETHLFANAIEKFLNFFIDQQRPSKRKAMMNDPIAIGQVSKIYEKDVKPYLKMFQRKRDNQDNTNGLKIEFEERKGILKKMDRYFHSEFSNTVIIHEDKLVENQGDFERRKIEALTQILDKYLENVYNKIQEENKVRETTVEFIQIATLLIYQHQRGSAEGEGEKSRQLQQVSIFLQKSTKKQYAVSVKSENYKFSLENVNQLLKEYKEKKEEWMAKQQNLTKRKEQLNILLSKYEVKEQKSEEDQ